jgi:hypothetical protein
MAKFTVSEFLKRLTQRFWRRGYEWGLRGIRIFLVVTFAAVLISTFAECQPFTHYWQVHPDPGPRCRQGYAQLLTMGVADIVTDVLLVAFPIPIIVHSGMPIKRKVSLVALFSMSVALIVITGARMPLVVQKRGLQQFRTMFASSEILAATIVSNAIILGSFLRDRGVKKPKFKAPSTTDSMERRGSARTHPLQPCDSDEDLARSLGYRTRPELSDKRTDTARPAPAADLDLLGGSKQGSPFANTNWQFPAGEGTSSRENSDPSPKILDPRDPMPSPRAGSGRRVSFFDVGGLLEPGRPVSPSPTDSVIAHDFAPQPRRGSRASNSLIPNSRLQTAQGRNSSRLSQQSEDYEMSARLGPQLRDAGGLLSGDGATKPEKERPRSSITSNSTSRADYPYRHKRAASLNRNLPKTSQGHRPSQTPGGLFSFRLSAPTIRTTTHPSYDGPSLQDPGGLLSSPSS